ncbi:MAG: DUF6456 domain-containing protein [Devosiaceae bacterium]|nr:DUF6456 domain-containing protein [Devosiaceae bacterium]
MIDKRKLKFVRSILGGNVAFKSLNGLYHLQTKGGSNIRGGCSLAASEVENLVSSGVLVLKNDKCFASDAAAAWLRRQLSGGTGFGEQHRQIEKTGDGLCLNLRESALRILATKTKGKPAFLLPHHLATANRVHALIMRTQMIQRTTMSYDPGRVGGKKSGSSVTFDLADSAVDAKKQLAQLLDKLPLDCAGVIMDVCGFQKGLQLIETERQWPRRSAKLILRIGLEQLAEQFGLSNVATGAKSTGNRSWMQPGSSPDFV